MEIRISNFYIIVWTACLGVIEASTVPPEHQNEIGRASVDSGAFELPNEASRRRLLNETIKSITKNWQRGLTSSSEAWRFSDVALRLYGGIPMGRIASKDNASRWPNRTMPYAIIFHRHESAKEKKRITELIKSAMREISSKTCFTFRECRTSDANCVDITVNDDFGCKSEIGRQSSRSRQKLFLGGYCIEEPKYRNGKLYDDAKGRILHELMHSLGFWHEHTRYDRDKYIFVNYSNIPDDPAIRAQFDKIPHIQTVDLGLEYDYASIMHYGVKAHAVDPFYNTITPLRETKGANIGFMDKLSERDLEKISRLYRCQGDIYCSKWSIWSQCTAGCGNGTQFRLRSTLEEHRQRDMNCSKTREERACFGKLCSVQTDCEVDEWTLWSLCSSTCGSGLRARTRIVKTHAAGGGKACPNLRQSETCQEKNCPKPAVNCAMNQWSDWSMCSASCDVGQMTRTRSVRQAPTLGGRPCPNSEQNVQRKSCQLLPCGPQPQHCELTTWSRWYQCSSTCGPDGIRVRTRDIKQQPAHGGRQCGMLAESRPCDTQTPCPSQIRDCEVGAWSVWTACSQSCGLHRTRSRSRQVLQQATIGGKQCPKLSEIQACEQRLCPTPAPRTRRPSTARGSQQCRVSAWQQWSPCSSTCGVGARTRTRTVVPKPMVDRRRCPEATQTANCIDKYCTDVPTRVGRTQCQLGPWTAWSRCSKNCGFGLRERARPILVVADDCPRTKHVETCYERADCMRSTASNTNNRYDIKVTFIFDKETPQVQIFDGLTIRPINTQWPRARSHATAVEWDGTMIYLIAGNGGFGTQVDQFDPLTQEFTKAPNLNVAVPWSQHAAGVFDKVIYSCSPQVCERYQPNVDKSWTISTQTSHSGQGVAFGGQLHLFAQNNQHWVLNPTLKKWIPQSSRMLESRHLGATAAELYKQLYVCGGVKQVLLIGMTPSTTCEKYDSGSKTWTSVPSMNTPKHMHRMVAMNGRLYALGGRKLPNDGHLNTIEEFDPEKGRWTVRRLQLARATDGAAAVAIPLIDNLGISEMFVPSSRMLVTE